MPTIEEIIEENAALRKNLRAAQAMISTQRETIKRVKATRLAIVSGGFVEEVNPTAEVEKVSEFIKDAESTYSEMVAALKFYSDAKNSEIGSETAVQALESIGENVKV